MLRCAHPDLRANGRNGRAAASGGSVAGLRELACQGLNLPVGHGYPMEGQPSNSSGQDWIGQLDGDFGIDHLGRYYRRVWQRC